MKLASLYHKLDGFLATLGGWLQPVLLLAIRGWWGWSFFLLGKSKLWNLDGTAGFFGKLGLPLPKVSAIIAGSFECACGLLLLVGLCSRVACVPLLFTLGVVYATASKGALKIIFTDPNKFTSGTPFLFLLAVLIVLAFGPGRLSLDALLFKNTGTKR